MDATPDRCAIVKVVRDYEDPLFAAGRELSRWLGQLAVPHGNPLSQLIYATVVRSAQTHDAISHMIGMEFDEQGAMLCRPLFEDMVVSHWLELNADDADWLVARFFRKRDAMALVQDDLARSEGWPLGPPLTDVDALKRRKNEVLKANAARGDWWDPGREGHGQGKPIGLKGVVDILEGAAERHERFSPRFAGGEEPLLRRWDRVLRSWYAQMLHHTAVGLPFQPHPTAPVETTKDDAAAFRVLFTAYWMYGQQIYLVHEHVGRDSTPFTKVFYEGLNAFGAVAGEPPLAGPA